MAQATPTQAAADTRQRLVATAAHLLRTQGYGATGMKQVAREAQATVGSLYHHFPGGKDELAAEGLHQAGAGYQLIIEAVLDTAPDLATGVRDSFVGAAALLRESGYADACPIATVAAEVAGSNEALRAVTGEIFEGWVAVLDRRLAAAGVPADDAHELALAYLAALEGAFLLCRATRSTAPMEAVGRVVAERVEAAFAAR